MLKGLLDLDASQSFLRSLGAMHHVSDLAVGALLRQVHQHTVVVLVQGAQVQPVPALHFPLPPSGSSSFQVNIHLLCTW